MSLFDRSRDFSTVFEFFTANNALFPAAASAQVSSLNEHPLIDFDDTIVENAVFAGKMSSLYNAAGPSFSVNIDWIATNIVNAVKWNVAFERNNPTGTTLASDSFAAIQTVTTTVSGTANVPARTTINFTQAQADAIAAGDAFRMRVTRDASAGGDTLIGDARILSVHLA